MGGGRVDREGPFFVHRVHLNTAGEAEADSACIEYNDLLCRPRHELRMAQALKAHADARRWDELHAPGMSEGPGLAALHLVFGAAHAADDVKASYSIDLADVRRTATTFIDRMSTHERTRYRRKLRCMGERCPATPSS